MSRIDFIPNRSFGYDKCKKDNPAFGTIGIAHRDNLMNKKRNIPAPNVYKIKNIFDKGRDRGKGVVLAESRDVYFLYT